uniref:Prohibitin n=1 Tax=Hucho hucho TaxID=62062 RepID=A0A4W5QTK5_9TELE
MNRSQVCSLLPQAEQQKQAAIISAEGDSQAALLIANSLQEAGDGLVELRKLEAAEDIAFQLSRSRNVTYLPAGQGTLLQCGEEEGPLGLIYGKLHIVSSVKNTKSVMQ